MAEQDFSKVVQQLQIANQKLANLERIQSEGGTAKGIIASALPEIINEKQIFGQEKQFQKDEGITAVDELQSETTDAIKDLEGTNKSNAKQNQAQLKMSAKIQQEFSNKNYKTISLENGLTVLFIWAILNHPTILINLGDFCLPYFCVKNS